MSCTLWLSSKNTIWQRERDTLVEKPENYTSARWSNFTSTAISHVFHINSVPSIWYDENGSLWSSPTKIHSWNTQKSTSWGMFYKILKQEYLNIEMIKIMEFEKFHTAKDTYGEMAAKCNMILWVGSMHRKTRGKLWAKGIWT